MYAISNNGLIIRSHNSTQVVLSPKKKKMEDEDKEKEKEKREDTSRIKRKGAAKKPQLYRSMYAELPPQLRDLSMRTNPTSNPLP